MPTTPWQAGGPTYGIHEVVSHLTKSGIGWDTICSRDGWCQMISSVPTGKVTGLTSKIGWTKVSPECSFPIKVEGSDVPCILLSRWVVAVLGLILFFQWAFF